MEADLQARLDRLLGIEPVPATTITGSSRASAGTEAANIGPMAAGAVSGAADAEVLQDEPGCSSLLPCESLNDTEIDHLVAMTSKADALLLSNEAGRLSALPVPDTVILPSFPVAPVHDVESTSVAIPGHDEHRCHVCGTGAHVWCADCSDEPFCARCWREVHVGVAGGLMAERTLRLHRTVPCTSRRLQAELPSVPKQPALSALPDAPTVPAAPVLRTAARSTSAKASVTTCQTCSANAYVCCLDCSRSYYCARCWRDIHVFPGSNLVHHRRDKISLDADATSNLRRVPQAPRRMPR